MLRHRPVDAHGIDRRNVPRRRGEVSDDPAQALVSAAHRRLNAVIGLRTSHGWAIVRTLSLAPTGVLLHHLDLLDPELEAPMRVRGRQVLASLAPLMGAPDRPGRPLPSSPLATVGTCVLAKRLVADLSAWANPRDVAGREREPLSSRHQPSAELTVGLVIPPADALVGRPLALIEGELVCLNDPNPAVLAVSLMPSRLHQLESLLARQTSRTR